MNEKYMPRIADSLLDLKLESFGATLIIGPKGCGKTTTAKNKAKSTIELQDEDEREKYLNVANIKPSLLLEGSHPRLIDEWQDAPKIWGAVRKSVDDNGENGLYILTGSSSSNVNTPHTGTLRISTLKMYPMTLFESGESNGTVSLTDLFNNKAYEGSHTDFTVDDMIFAICRGGWPKALKNRSRDAKLEIAKELYIQTCHRDISKIDGVKRNPYVAEKILRSYSRNLCTLANTNTLLNDVNSDDDISYPTFLSYVNALSDLFIIEDLPAWCPSIRSKTAIRSGNKRNLVDPSIAVAALGLSPEYFNTDFKTLGFLFESLCIRDLRAYSSRMRGRMSYYRDRYNLEADGVLHLDDGRYALIEFKLGESEIDKGVRHLNKIEQLIEEAKGSEEQVPLRMPDLKLIITAGEYGYARDGVYVIPIGCLRD